MDSVDARLAECQRRQHGLVTGAQARAAGVSRSALRNRVTRGGLVEVRPAVYGAAGMRVTREQMVLATVLACGETAFASHALAASLWGLPLPPGDPMLEITTVLERRPRLEGVVFHRSGLLDDIDVTRVRGITVATPERVAVDLSSRLDVEALGRLVDEAVRRRITTLWRVGRTAARLGRAPGRSPRKLEEMMRRRVSGGEERESVLEDFVFDALRRFRLPLPLAQHSVKVGGRRRRIDLCYVEDRLALEAKGFGPHSPRHVFDDDALRGNDLLIAGFRVLEFTTAFTDWKVASQVAAALGLPVPQRPTEELSFARWLQLR